MADQLSWKVSWNLLLKEHMAKKATNDDGNEWRTTRPAHQLAVLTAFVAKPLSGCGWFTDWPLKLAKVQLGHLQSYMHLVDKKKKPHRRISTWGIYAIADD